MGLVLLLLIHQPLQDLLGCLADLLVAHRAVAQEATLGFLFQSWRAAVAVTGPLTPV